MTDETGWVIDTSYTISRHPADIAIQFGRVCLVQGCGQPAEALLKFAGMMIFAAVTCGRHSRIIPPLVATMPPGYVRFLAPSALELHVNDGGLTASWQLAKQRSLSLLADLRQGAR